MRADGMPVATPRSCTWHAHCRSGSVRNIVTIGNGWLSGALVLPLLQACFASSSRPPEHVPSGAVAPVREIPVLLGDSGAQTSEQETRLAERLTPDGLDRALALLVQQALTRSTAVHAEVGVRVAARIVTLQGRVDTPAQALALEKAASNVRFVRGVVNELYDAPYEQPQSEQLRQQVRAALSADACLDAAAIRVTVVGFTVYLQGYVRSVEEQRRALHYARAVPGLLGTFDELQVLDAPEECERDERALRSGHSAFKHRLTQHRVP